MYSEYYELRYFCSDPGLSLAATDFPIYEEPRMKLTIRLRAAEPLAYARAPLVSVSGPKR
jgi:hypothetical protein